MLNNFAPLYVKPSHFSLGFSGTLRLSLLVNDIVTFFYCDKIIISNYITNYDIMSKLAT